jgi:hypothetical protein
MLKISKILINDMGWRKTKARLACSGGQTIIPGIHLADHNMAIGGGETE